MSVTFIGDVHGWSDRLERLLAKIEPPLVFMGDLIDRGPDAPGVVARVRALCERGDAHCILGNHEYGLLRGLGSPRLGLSEDEIRFEAWRERFGGVAVLKSFGLAEDDAAGLRRALGDHLDWFASLPWVLEGSEGVRTWVAVHAGLDVDPYLPQIKALHAGWANDDGAPAPLFDKLRARALPCDLPSSWCVISGHTPVRTALVTPQRILCDTSGGLAKRPLSAVVWPEGTVVTSEA